MESCVGDWMGRLYDAGGGRWDHGLFLDHDGRYERTACRQPDFERTDAGRWSLREEGRVIRLEPDAPQFGARPAGSWWVLSVRTCEDSHVLLVLREMIFAGRNLPILFYRVRVRGRANGPDGRGRAEPGAAAGPAARKRPRPPAGPAGRTARVPPFPRRLPTVTLDAPPAVARKECAADSGPASTCAPAPPARTRLVPMTTTTLTPPPIPAPATVTPDPKRKSQAGRIAKKVAKRVIPFGLAAYFIPIPLAVYVGFGLVDFARNSRRTLANLDRYFAGNGVFTWLLSPFNLLMDAVSLPYWNRGIYRLDQLPAGHRAEINTLIEACHARDLVGLLEAKMGEKKRGMFFFQWYGKLLPGSVDVPEFRQRYKYIRTIGVSIFNKKQSTGLHFGPLRVTLRVLYNINTIDNPDVYVQVGDHKHVWRDGKLFIFDDTLQHLSRNESDAVRYCLFVDILRPSPVPWLLSGILTAIRLGMAPFRAVFYKHWTFLK